MIFGKRCMPIGGAEAEVILLALLQNRKNRNRSFFVKVTVIIAKDYTFILYLEATFQ